MCCARALVSSVRGRRPSCFLVVRALKKGRMSAALGPCQGGLCPAHPPHPPLPRGLSPGDAKAAPLRDAVACQFMRCAGLCSERALHAGWVVDLRRADAVVGFLLCLPAYPGVLEFQRLSRHKRPAPRCAGPLHLFQDPLEFCAAPGCTGGEQCRSAFGSFL